jgi:hypothetical protein
MRTRCKFRVVGVEYTEYEIKGNYVFDSLKGTDGL